MTDILLATDGSDPARLAEQTLIDTYDPETDSVHVFTVSDVPDLMSGYVHADEYQGMSLEEVQKRFEEKSEDRAQTVADRLREKGFDVSVTVCVGKPGPEICRVADEDHMDVILLGRKGHSALAEVLLGSTSHYVIHHAPCAVTVVPRNDE
jgi:nucleotide-binding universal stress UspA family protein